MGLALAADRQPARLEADLQVLLGEAGDFSPHGEGVVRLGDREMHRMEQLTLGLEPVLQLVSDLPAVPLKDLEGPTRGGRDLHDFTMASSRPA